PPTDKPHPAKPNSSVTAGIVGDDDLIRGQRHSQAAWKNDKRARRPIPNDRELRDEFPFAIEGGMRRELNQQGDVFHVISEGAVRTSIAGYGRIHEVGPGVDATPQVVQILEAFTQKVLGGGLA